MCCHSSIEINRNNLQVQGQNMFLNLTKRYETKTTLKYDIQTLLNMNMAIIEMKYGCKINIWRG